MVRLTPEHAPYQTDGGNRIIDCRFSSITDPARLAADLKAIVGVFETGIFIGLCDVLVVGHADAVETIESPARDALRRPAPNKPGSIAVHHGST